MSFLHRCPSFHDAQELAVILREYPASAADLDDLTEELASRLLAVALPEFLDSDALSGDTSDA